MLKSTSVKGDYIFSIMYSCNLQIGFGVVYFPSSFRMLPEILLPYSSRFLICGMLPIVARTNPLKSVLDIFTSFCMFQIPNFTRQGAHDLIHA